METASLGNWHLKLWKHFKIQRKAWNTKRSRGKWETQTWMLKRQEKAFNPNKNMSRKIICKRHSGDGWGINKNPLCIWWCANCLPRTSSFMCMRIPQTQYNSLILAFLLGKSQVTGFFKKFCHVKFWYVRTLRNGHHC